MVVHRDRRFTQAIGSIIPGDWERERNGHEDAGGRPRTSAIGLGEEAKAESIATIHAALDAGVTLLDTGDFYGQGTTSC